MQDSVSRNLPVQHWIAVHTQLLPFPTQSKLLSFGCAYSLDTELMKQKFVPCQWITICQVRLNRWLWVDGHPPFPPVFCGMQSYPLCFVLLLLCHSRLFTHTRDSWHSFKCSSCRIICWVGRFIPMSWQQQPLASFPSVLDPQADWPETLSQRPNIIFLEAICNVMIHCKCQEQLYSFPKELYNAFRDQQSVWIYLECTTGFLLDLARLSGFLFVDRILGWGVQIWGSGAIL